MSANREHQHLDDLRRADLPDRDHRIANALDDWLSRMHGITSSGHHVGLLQDLLLDEGLAIGDAAWKEQQS